MDLDLRKLRYFVAVGELEHFGRAAERLFIAQPVRRRQIRALQSELGCQLLQRTTRSVRLTAAGEQLLTDAPGILAAAEGATRRAHEAARGVQRLVVGFGSSLPVSPAVRAYSERHPDVEVSLLHLKWYEQAEAVRDGRADVGLLRLPFDTDGLRCWPIGSEPKVVCLPTDHPLAAHDEVTAAQLADEEVLDARARRTGTVEEKLELVSAGVGVAVLPESVARYYSRADLVHRPLPDTEPAQICLAAAVDRGGRHITEFVSTAVPILREALTDRVADQPLEPALSGTASRA